jgi:preprotein translocase subunit SecB
MADIIAKTRNLFNCPRPAPARALCSAALHATARRQPIESKAMTDTPPPAGANPNPQAQGQTGPLTIHGQYIKDLSFENPRAPQSLIEQKQPQLSLNVNVTTRQFDPKTFEVTLTVEANAQTPEKEPLFMLELVYAGTVSLGEVPQDAYGPLLLIETPRLLFPFARAIVANATREAGFPPLNIAPVDFVALYRQQLEASGGQIPGVPMGPVGHA